MREAVPPRVRDHLVLRLCRRRLAGGGHRRRVLGVPRRALLLGQRLRPGLPLQPRSPHLLEGLLLGAALALLVQGARLLLQQRIVGALLRLLRLELRLRALPAPRLGLREGVLLALLRPALVEGPLR